MKSRVARGKMRWNKMRGMRIRAASSGHSIRGGIFSVVDKMNLFA